MIARSKLGLLAQIAVTLLFTQYSVNKRASRGRVEMGKELRMLRASGWRLHHWMVAPDHVRLYLSFSSGSTASTRGSGRLLGS